ncbi:MAG: ORF6N domain-containing protein [Victivallaceae bacterium]|nr:ORF6N domain-containing protein [Victivallaceae bacterium]
MSDLIPIESKILVIRGQKILLDSDLAVLYAVSVGRLNEAVKRKIKRFPSNFMFQLNNKEVTDLKSQFAIAKAGRGGRRTPPYAFTEQGVAMLSSVLNSERAIQVNITIMNTFVKMRELLLNNVKMAEKLREIEDRIDTQEMNTIIIMDKLRTLTNPAQKTPRKIGFNTKK